MKIIKSDSLGDIAWDEGSEEMAWEDFGNNWSKATLQKTLNEDYFSKSGTYSSNGLNATVQGMVANVVWTLGGSGDEFYSQGTAQYYYNKERSDTVPSGNPKAFVGKVGLIFPSDYGYATGGGTTYNRTACLAKEMYNWLDLSDCYNNDWLYSSNFLQWTLTPYSDDALTVFDVDGFGYVGNGDAILPTGVRPVVYLNSDVNIMGGTGENGDPYILSE